MALADRCVHRRFPLSESRLDGDPIVCGYHGFTYDTTGACVYVPGQTRIPRTARVPAYPVVEQDSFVWVWIGDPDLADADADPAGAVAGRSPGWTTVRGMEPLAARYGLLVDNLLDLSHETYLHGGYIGTPEVAETPITTEVDEDAGIVYVSRHMDDAECPPFYAKSTGIEGRITRWQDIEYHPPCLYLLHSRIAPAGVLPDAGRQRPRRLPRRDRVRDHAGDRAQHATTSGWSRGTSPSTTRRSRSSCARATTPWSCRTSTRSTSLEQVIAGRAGRLPGAVSINIDTGGLAARRMLARMAAGGADARYGRRRHRRRGLPERTAAGTCLPAPSATVDGCWHRAREAASSTSRSTMCDWMLGTDGRSAMCRLRRGARVRRIR